MKIIALFFALLSTGAVVMAHGDNDHVRGTVTQISAQEITIQTTGKATKTLTLNDRTTVEKNRQKATLADLKVGDRVVIDVPKNTNEARVIQFGAAAKPAASAGAHAHAGQENK